MISHADDMQGRRPKQVFPIDYYECQYSTYYLVPDIAGLIVCGLQLWSDVNGPGLVLYSLHAHILCCILASQKE